MAFPTNGGTATTAVSTAGTPHTVNLNNTSVAGDCIVIVGRANVGGAAFTFPSGFSLPVDVDHASTSTDRFVIAYKILAAGNAEIGASTMSVTPPGSSKAAYACQLVKPPAGEVLQTPEFSTQASGSSATPDPPNLAPAAGTQDYFWLWLGGWEGEQTSPPATPPTNYTQIGAASGTAGNVDTNCRVLIARRSLNASAENPPSVTLSLADEWVAYTGAIYSAAAPAGTTVKQLSALGVG